MNKQTPVGQRKMRHAREMAFLLLLGFIVAVFAKAPAELFVTFVTGLGVQSGAFIWGNAKEHLAKSPTPAA
jgi:hypothetical protein